MADTVIGQGNPGDDPLADILGPLKALGTSFQSFTNQWAALSAQNRDIAEGNWTLNNLVFQFKELPQATQTALIAAAAWLVFKFVKG